MLLLAALAAFFVQLRAWSFLCDDAFISFRYADHLGRYGMPVFNVGVEPPEFVEGYTNFSWVLLLGLGVAVGVSPPTLAPLLTGASMLAVLVLSVLLVRSLRPEASASLEPLDLAPALLLVAMPEAMVWSGGGLETAFAAAVVLGAMLSWQRGALRRAAGLAALAGLTRPDALLPIALFGLGWLLAQAPAVIRTRRAPKIPWRRVGVAATVFAVPLLLHLLWRRSYYGAWVPNTWPIKAHGMLLRDTYGQAYVQAWIDNVHLAWWTPVILGLRPRHAVVVLPVAGVVTYGWWVGGDFMAYSRFYVVATALLAVLAGWVLADACVWLKRRVAAAPWAGLALVCLCAGLLGRDAKARHAHDVARGGKWIDGRWEGVVAMDQFAKVGLAAGQWMRGNLPPDTLITVGAAGAVPYGAGLPTLDAYGLVDPVIATLPEAGPYTGKGARPGHQLQAPRDYVLSRDPDLLCHVGYRGPRKPPERRPPRGYGRAYRWACIDLPAIEDEHAEGGELPAGVYCCRRPADRVVGPFGAEAP
ncbi:MAG: hypothetical protein AAGA54_29120 [Myxococcota bacterium]